MSAMQCQRGSVGSASREGAALVPKRLTPDTQGKHIAAGTAMDVLTTEHLRTHTSKCNANGCFAAVHSGEQSLRLISHA